MARAPLTQPGDPGHGEDGRVRGAASALSRGCGAQEEAAAFPRETEEAGEERGRRKGGGGRGRGRGRLGEGRRAPGRRLGPRAKGGEEAEVTGGEGEARGRAARLGLGAPGSAAAGWPLLALPRAARHGVERSGDAARHPTPAGAGRPRRHRASAATQRGRPAHPHRVCCFPGGGRQTRF